MSYDFHRYANIFPLLEGEAFERLAADILDNGLIEPVVLYDGAILDGRNRYRACQHVGVPASVIHAPVSRHSAKPESVYELIERMYPHGPYLELFAREPREGWAVFGNEVAYAE